MIKKIKFSKHFPNPKWWNKRLENFIKITPFRVREIIFMKFKQALILYKISVKMGLKPVFY